MLRRDALKLGLGLGVAAALPTATGTATAAEQANAVERCLFHLPPARPVSRDSLVRALTTARDLYHEARYAELGAGLPRLLADSAGNRFHDIAARSYVLLAQLAIKNYQAYSWVAAERARGHAEQTSSPVIAAEAAHSMAIAMRRSGEYQASVDHLTAAAANLGERPDEVAMRGSLLLTASYSAAQGRWRAQAMDFIGEAEELATRRDAQGQRLYIPGVFSEVQAQGFRISVHHALREPDQAINHAQKIDVLALPNAERRGRMCMDVARVYMSLDEPTRAFATLRQLDQWAPQEARRPKIRALATELATTKPELPGIRRFAEHIGAAA
ncbi:XRE family transcriptional regulator [Streptomyces sp. NPDC046685]|uniref:XRE family transcriptional regulator n=1 Tax=Streptomyces sp. NPDC046685 TaxID=3157202 RepID=UPI0033DA2A2E